MTIPDGLKRIREAGYHNDRYKFNRISEQMSLHSSIREAHYTDGQINRVRGRLCECRACVSSAA